MLYSSTRRSFTHFSRRSLRNPRTGPDTRCESGQKGHTNLVPCALGIFSTITAQPFRHRRNTAPAARASASKLLPLPSPPASLLALLRVAVLLFSRDVWPGVLPVWLIFATSVWLPSVSLPNYNSRFTSVLRTLYLLRRSTIIRSLLRFLRVFAPRVGNPQGVCGWFPFTRPSPPPCG